MSDFAPYGISSLTSLSMGSPGKNRADHISEDLTDLWIELPLQASDSFTTESLGTLKNFIRHFLISWHSRAERHVRCANYVRISTPWMILHIKIFAGMRHIFFKALMFLDAGAFGCHNDLNCRTLRATGCLSGSLTFPLNGWRRHDISGKWERNNRT